MDWVLSISVGLLAPVTAGIPGDATVSDPSLQIPLFPWGHTQIPPRDLRCQRSGLEDADIILDVIRIFKSKYGERFSEMGYSSHVICQALTLPKSSLSSTISSSSTAPGSSSGGGGGGFSGGGGSGGGGGGW